MRLTRRGLFKLGAGVAAAAVVGLPEAQATPGDGPMAKLAQWQQTYGAMAGRAMGAAREAEVNAQLHAAIRGFEEIREFSGVRHRLTTTVENGYRTDEYEVGT